MSGSFGPTAEIEPAGSHRTGPEEISTATVYQRGEEDATMSYWNICPDCGAHLDPGEKCDCKEAGTCQAKNMSLTAAGTGLKQEPDRSVVRMPVHVSA